MKTKLMTITFYNDPGHGWAKVKRTLLHELGIAARVSPFSYQRGEWVYLEEDADFSLLVQALRERGIEYRLKERYADKHSRVRSYEPYNAERSEA